MILDGSGHRHRDLTGGHLEWMYQKDRPVAERHGHSGRWIGQRRACIRWTLMIVPSEAG